MQTQRMSKKQDFLFIVLLILLGGGGVQGQGKGQRLMGIKAVSDYIVLATCQNKIYKK